MTIQAETGAQTADGTAEAVTISVPAPDAAGRLSDEEVARQLTRIPAEYQEKFRLTIEAEIHNAGRDQTDSDRLAYLRQRQESIRRGDYIRPDGKTNTLILDPDRTYDEKGMAALVAADEDGSAGSSFFWSDVGRETKLKLALLAALFVGLLFVVNRGRQQRLAQDVAPTVAAPAAAAGERAAGPTPTPTLVAPTGADATLQTIGGLGGSLTLGRPSALTIRYGATEETVALPIDPARVSTRGELPFNAEAMASDSPVAVWVFGTVLNYALGLPPGLVGALRPGDRLRLATDTGFSLAFVITETGTRASYETGALLSQDRVGMTLFGLPAPAADGVPVAVAGYDLGAEDDLTAVYKEVGHPLLADSDLQITEAVFSDRSDGQLDVTLTGTGRDDGGVLAVHGRSHQTTAAGLPGEDPWRLTFTLPATVVGEPLTAVYRRLPQGESAVVDLGAAPDLIDALIVVPPEAMWQAATGEMVVVTEVTNPGPGQVCLPPDFLQIPVTGGDAQQSLFTSSQCLAAGETRMLRLPAAHPGPETPLVVRVGAELWGTP